MHIIFTFQFLYFTYFCITFLEESLYCKERITIEYCLDAYTEEFSVTILWYDILYRGISVTILWYNILIREEGVMLCSLVLNSYKFCLEIYSIHKLVLNIPKNKYFYIPKRQQCMCLKFYMNIHNCKVTMQFDRFLNKHNAIFRCP